MTEEEAAAWRPTPDLQALELLFETPFGDFDVLAVALGPGVQGFIEYETLAADAVTIALDGIEVAVASLSHLASKLGARRPKDLRARVELERLLEDRQ